MQFKRKSVYQTVSTAKRLRLDEEDTSSVSDSFTYNEDNAQDEEILDESDLPENPPLVRVPPGIYPTSSFMGDNVPQRLDEDAALDDLLARLPQIAGSNEYVALDLEQFEIYRPHSQFKHPGTLVSLNELNTVGGDTTYCFEGFLCHEDVQHYVQNVPFRVICIEGYCIDAPTVLEIYLQSFLTEKSNIYYRLRRPSSRYAPYHEPYSWLATFTKHFVDYLEETTNVSLRNFQSEFYAYLHQKYNRSRAFRRWLHQFPCKDFRQVVIAHCEYLWKEATDVSEQARSHSLWSEIDLKQLSAIKEHPVVQAKTIVTPFVYNCFRKMYFSAHLKTCEIDASVLKTITSRAAEMKLSVLPFATSAVNFNRQDTEDDVFRQHWRPPRNIKVGDTVVINRDQDGPWLDESPVWYAYVQAIQKDAHGEYLEILWLYRPSETICDSAVYPIPNELFLSDHCNCHDKRIRPNDVMALLPITHPTKSSIPSGPFVRQTYVTPDQDTDKDVAFTTLRPDHFLCGHKSANESEHDRVNRFYPRGSTALARLPGIQLLQPIIIIKHNKDREIVVRCLRRRTEFDRQARPNELLDTSETITIHPEYIIRHCHIRTFHSDLVRKSLIPPPYSYDGAADCWAITGYLCLPPLGKGSPSIKTLDPQIATNYIQGFDPTAPSHKLIGLSLFTGGGSFDRGLEEGGGIQTKWAVEMEREPIYTYRANLKDPSDVTLYMGSVNDYLWKALKNSNSVSISVAPIGQVEFISAGSPCKGFSRANQDRMAEKALGNVSLVASVLSFINVYCPEYAILENVFDMCKDGGRDRKENVFSQVIATIVGIGYQVQTVLSDAWTHGSGQTRSRLLVLLTAPGLSPLDKPPQTHTHPTTTVGRAMGTTKSGLKFGVRNLQDDTPFGYVSAKQLSKDLPPIDAGVIRTVVPFPDHRIVQRETFPRSLVMGCIPRFPRKSGYISALKAGLLPQEVKKAFSTRSAEWSAKGSSAYTRIHPDGLFPTIRTRGSPDDSRHGACLHWDEPRAMSVMEARRAQSVPDHEVLIGTPAQQWHIVGNGVDRKVSVALGMNLRIAWLDPRTKRIISCRRSDADQVVSLDGTIDVSSLASHLAQVAELACDKLDQKVNGLEARG